MKHTNYLCVLFIFHYSITLWFIIYPLSIIIQPIMIRLIFSTTISQSLFKLSNINLFLCYKLTLTRIKILLKITDILMNGICKFSITIFNTFIKITFINLSFINKISIFNVFAIFNNTNENTFNMINLIVNTDLFCLLVKLFKMFMKFNLFTFKGFWITFSKT